jgi:glycosyl transferase family 1
VRIAFRSGQPSCGGRFVPFGRRVLLWSQRGLDTAPFRCVGYEFEDVIAAVEPGATIVSPRPFVRSPSVRLINLVSRDGRMRLPSSAGYRKPVVEDEYDLFFADFQFLPDLDSLRALPRWQRRARRSVCVIEELWARDIPRWKTLPRLLQGFDHVFLECSGSVEPLQAMTGIPCSFLAPAVDTKRFVPVPAPPRVVDVCRVGRRDAAVHALLLEASQRAEIFYEFDSVCPERVWDTAEHREHLAGILKRSRYVIVNPGKYNRHNETSGQQELGFRFFEGAAAGAVMIGTAPRIQSFDDNFDWNDAVIEVDDASVLESIATLDLDQDRLDRIRRDNVTNSLRRHDWVHRWQQVLDAVGLPTSESIETRKRELERLAAHVERDAVIDLREEESVPQSRADLRR